MKKIFMFLLFAMFIVAIGYSQSITITSPHSGNCWEKGKTYTITWTKSGTMNANVKIRLYQGGTKILAITDSTPNNGSYSWTVPATVADGSYYIRVKTIDNAVYDDSDTFQIKVSCSLGGGTITITSPHSGDCWKQGSTHTITWTKSGTMNANVKIRLMQSGAKILAITDSTPNNGSYSWTVPATVTDGYYQIRVKTIDNAVYDDSDTFQIKASCSSGGSGGPHIDPWIIEKIRLARPIWGWGPWGPIGPDGPGPLCPQCLRLDISRIKEIATPPVTILKRGEKTVPVQIFLFQGEEPLTEVGEITPEGKLNLNGRFSRHNRNMLTINVGKELNLNKGELKLVFKNAETGKIINSVPVSIRNRKMVR